MFNPFKFVYNKPPTVEELAPAPATVVSVANSSSLNQTSAAGTLSGQISDLIAMSTYLQQVIVGRSQHMGVDIDTTIDPATVRALMAIFGGQLVPPTVTIPMLNTMLDAYTGTVQLEMVSKGTAVEPNPYQVSDLIQVTRTVEAHLANNGSYQAALPLWLRPLKSDSLMLQGWQDGLNQYPAVSAGGPTPTTYRPDVIPARGVDISPSLASYISDYTGRLASVYTGVYQQLATPNPVEQDIQNVVTAQSSLTLVALLQLVAQLTLLQSTIHKQQLNDMSDDLGNFAYARMGAELSGSVFSLDMIAQLAGQPLQSALGDLTQLVATVGKAASISGRVNVGPLKGMISFNVAGSVSTSGTPPGLESQTMGMRAMAEHIEWSSQQAKRHSSVIQKQFQRLSERRLSGSIDRLDLMSSSSCLSTILAIAQAFITSNKNGSIASGPLPQQQGQTLNAILSNLQTGTNTSFVVQSNNTVLVNPPDMPAPPAQALRVLARSGMATANRA